MRTLTGLGLIAATFLVMTATAHAVALDFISVPEPASMALLLSGLGGLAVAVYRKKALVEFPRRGRRVAAPAAY